MPDQGKKSAETVRSIAPTTPTLLQCARQLEAGGLINAARSAFQAAALADDSPKGRLELAAFHFQTECFAEATSEYESLLRRAAETDDVRLAEVARHNLAAVLRATGQSYRAASLQASATAQEIAERGMLSTEDLTGRALDAVNQGDLQLAENLLLRSLSVEKHSGNRQGEATDCANLGALALLRGDRAVGIRFLARAYHSHQSLNDHLNAGTDLLNLAEAFQSAGRWSLAARCLRRAIRQFESCGATESLARTHERLHEIHQLQNVLNRNPLLN